VKADVSDPLAVLPMRLTYRTARVLQALAEHPGQSNREVADQVGIGDQGQTSKLLSRLARLGLLVNGEPVKGERNKWVLTTTGRQVTRSIQSYALSASTERQAI
jgi:DNA-binding MarR family transcriptional regulator